MVIQMSNKFQESSGTAFSSGKWTEVEEAPLARSSSETSVQMSKDVYLIQGRPAGRNATKGYELIIAPATIMRKLAIRKLNGEIEGWTVKSDTTIKSSR